MKRKRLTGYDLRGNRRGRVDRSTVENAKSNLMEGMKLAISTQGGVKNENVRKVMIYHFKRIEKFLGYEPDTYNPFC